MFLLSLSLSLFLNLPSTSSGKPIMFCYNTYSIHFYYYEYFILKSGSEFSKSLFFKLIHKKNTMRRIITCHPRPRRPLRRSRSQESNRHIDLALGDLQQNDFTSQSQVFLPYSKKLCASRVALTQSYILWNKTSQGILWVLPKKRVYVSAKTWKGNKSRPFIEESRHNEHQIWNNGPFWFLYVSASEYSLSAIIGLTSNLG